MLQKQEEDKKMERTTGVRNGRIGDAAVKFTVTAKMNEKAVMSATGQLVDRPTHTICFGVHTRLSLIYNRARS
jgi:hypothetical protein